MEKLTTWCRDLTRLGPTSVIEVLASFSSRRLPLRRDRIGRSAITEQKLIQALCAPTRIIRRNYKKPTRSELSGTKMVIVGCVHLASYPVNLAPKSPESLCDKSLNSAFELSPRVVTQEYRVSQGMMGAFSERGDHVIPVSGKDSILLVEVVIPFSVSCSYSDRPIYVPTQKNRYIASFP